MAHAARGERHCRPTHRAHAEIGRGRHHTTAFLAVLRRQTVASGSARLPSTSAMKIATVPSINSAGTSLPALQAPSEREASTEGSAAGVLDHLACMFRIDAIRRINACTAVFPVFTGGHRVGFPGHRNRLPPLRVAELVIGTSENGSSVSPSWPLAPVHAKGISSRSSARYQSTFIPKCPSPSRNLMQKEIAHRSDAISHA